ncbi:ubiquitin carboxyl-terminal hydrolase CYLD-like [Watersipora subatra]|uniref:ubiquitin carboxyl-terminal hydrolase CYLD-like n=1 Tax=Watersipora subatra TaxID=2589382 RepID=UPI00355C18F2
MSTTSSHQSSVDEPLQPETKKYLLLKDQQARSKRGVNSTGKIQLISKHEEQRVLKGSLWEQRDSVSPNHSLSSFGSAGSKSTVLSGKSASLALPHANNIRKLELDSIEYDEVRLLTSESNVSGLTEKLCRLLLAIPDCEERYKVLMDQDHISTAELINVNSRVIVSTRRLEPCKGLVRWKGRIANKQGISFGVEIQDPTKFGSGDSDGTFNSVRLFTCAPGNGVFVNISHIKLIPPQPPKRKMKHQKAERNHTKPLPETINGQDGKLEDLSISMEDDLNIVPVVNPQINDRVIWVGEDGYERAIIKWIGTLPDDDKVQEGETLIGVEFDNPVGKGTGFYRKQRLFHSKKGHASLVPLVGLYQDLQEPAVPAYSTPSPPPEFSDAIPDIVPTAEGVLRDLALDIVDTDFKLTSGAINRKESKNSKISQKIGGLLSSPKRLLNGSRPHKGKHNGSNVKCERSVSSSNDSLEQERRGLSPHRTTEQLSPQRKNIAKSPAGLIVPTNKQRGSSIGSISPKSCDGWSQGSDSSPSRTNISPLCHGIIDTAAGVVGPSPIQAAKTSIVKTSPARRKTDTSPEVKAVGQVCVSKVCRATPSTSQVTEGSSVSIDGQPGVVKWIGYELSKPGRYFAGVQMMESNGSCTNGWYGQERLVFSSTNDIMFVNLRKCEVLPNTASSGNRESSQCRTLEPIIEGHQPPPHSLKKNLIGQWRGIQGDQNSCYMDSCLYVMFAFTGVFDSLLLLPKKSNDIPSYTDIQRVLRCHIANPLRCHGLVKKDAIHRLRKLLDQLGIVKGLLADQKDPEEFINLLLIDVFRSSPPLQLSNGQSCHSFHLLSEKDARIAFPTVQELLEHSCAQEQLKFKKIPPFLILHMPRFGRDYRMYDKILPSIDLDITDVLQGATRYCYVCGEQAMWECPECYGAENEWKKSTFCHECSNTVHKHDKRSGHMPINLKLFEETGTESVDKTRPPALLRLFAVLCIDTSHYVAFTSTNAQDSKAPWLFFDSMSDREAEECRPKVTQVEDVPFWLSKGGADRIAKDFDAVPAKIKRLIQDGYICFYCQKELVS